MVLLAQGAIAGMMTAERLLDATDPIVARDTAIALTHGGKKTRLSDLTEAGRARWREVIIVSPPDEFWYSEILQERSRPIHSMGLCLVYPLEMELRTITGCYHTSW